MSATAPTMTELPLRYRTPKVWARQALRDPLALLNDHAHLEKKAAGNALEMLCRYPEPEPPATWVEVMTAVARDETDHLARVTRLLRRRGGQLSRAHHNPYAAALRQGVRLGRGPQELIDRLLVSALIELRSCERFALLAQGATDAELASLYDDLFSSEAGHYRLFLRLAGEIPSVQEVEARWGWWLDEEARVISAQPPGPRMHSGVGE